MAFSARYLYERLQKAAWEQVTSWQKSGYGCCFGYPDLLFLHAEIQHCSRQVSANLVLPAGARPTALRDGGLPKCLLAWAFQKIAH